MPSYVFHIEIFEAYASIIVGIIIATIIAKYRTKMMRVDETFLVYMLAFILARLSFRQTATAIKTGNIESMITTGISKELVIGDNENPHMVSSNHEPSRSH